MVGLTRLTEHERQDLADLLADLTLDEWNAASLCAGWRVRDVVAHMFGYEELGVAQILGLCVLGRFHIDRINELALAPIGDMPPALLVATAKAHITPRRLTAGVGGRIALTETMIHQQDIRRPLRRPRTISARAPSRRPWRRAAFTKTPGEPRQVSATACRHRPGLDGSGRACGTWACGSAAQCASPVVVTPWANSVQDLGLPKSRHA